jgi:glutathione reductase (NADPH)
MPSHDYDLFVIGGGSGGVRSARVAASLGKKVAIAEEYRFGGTCVIRGCVPKKLFVYASQFHEHFEDAAGYGWTVGETSFDWKKLVDAKDREISRLEGLYRKGLDNAGAEIIQSRAELTGPNSVRIMATGQIVTAERILIAVGGSANHHPALPGHEFCITSNEAFHLETRQYLSRARCRDDADLSRQGNPLPLRPGHAPGPARGHGGEGHPHHL